MNKFPFPKVYGAVTVGERGQVVIPAQIRKNFKIIPGDRLIVFAKNDGPIAFIPSSKFGEFLDSASDMLKKMKKKIASRRIEQ
jgi:AbrB family looped-hinge helix DNA binding protein